MFWWIHDLVKNIIQWLWIWRIKKCFVAIGVVDNSLRKRMLREPKLTLEKAIALGQSAEQAKMNVKKGGRNLQNKI